MKAWLHLAGAIWAFFCVAILALSLRSNLIHNERAMAALSAAGLILMVLLALLSLLLYRDRVRAERLAAADARALMMTRVAYAVWLARRSGGRL